jgi:hypothetical protein
LESVKIRIPLLAGVIALSAVVFYTLHGGSNADTKSSTERKADAARTAARNAGPFVPPQLGAASADVKPADVEHANVEGLAEPLEPGYLAVAHAAKECYRKRPAPKPIRPNGPDETIESIQLEYRQVSDHGVGRVEKLKVVHGKLTDPSLQACIVKVAAAATWSTSEPDGVIGTLEQNVNVGDLMRPAHGLPPASQRSPKPSGPPPPALAGPLGKPAPDADDDHPGVIVAEPRLAGQPK